MFESAVFALRLFTDDDKVKVVVACHVAWETLHQHHVGVQVQVSSRHEGRKAGINTDLFNLDFYVLAIILHMHVVCPIIIFVL